MDSHLSVSLSTKHSSKSNLQNKHNARRCFTLFPSILITAQKAWQLRETHWVPTSKETTSAHIQIFCDTASQMVNTASEKQYPRYVNSGQRLMIQQKNKCGFTPVNVIEHKPQLQVKSAKKHKCTPLLHSVPKHPYNC